MIELTFVAYLLSLISLALVMVLWVEIREIKEQRKRDQINRRLNSIVKSVQPKRPKSYWD